VANIALSGAGLRLRIPAGVAQQGAASEQQREAAMRLTIFLPHGGPLTTPQLIRDFSLKVEDLGFGGLGFFDHVALPRSVSSQYTLGPENVPIPDDNLKKTLTPFYECVATMAYVAGLTRRVRLTTGVLVLPLRNPVYNARQLATIDMLSGGRLALGVGVGWLKEEADMMQMPWDRRGARTEEHIALMRTLWQSDAPYVSFDGEFYRFEEIDPAPHPAQRPLPILIGGHAAVALKRAGRIGDGWISANLPVDRQEAGMADVRAAATAAGRDADLLTWNTLTDARFDKGEVKQPDALMDVLTGYRDLGVTETCIRAMGRTREDIFVLLDWLAANILPHFPQKFD